MRILLVSATAMEVQPLLTHFEPVIPDNFLNSFSYGEHQIDVLTTGIGMMATAFSIPKWGTSAYDFAINIGLAGSFKEEIPVGSVVEVATDRFADFGAQDVDRFIDGIELGFIGTEDPPFKDGFIKGLGDFPSGLPKANGISVNTVHGDEKGIAAVKERLDPDVESMEGVAFYYACYMMNIPSIQIRAISNKVVPRSRETWNVRLAIEELTAKTLAFIESLPA